MRSKGGEAERLATCIDDASITVLGSGDDVANMRKLVALYVVVQQ